MYAEVENVHIYKNVGCVVFIYILFFIIYNSNKYIIILNEAGRGTEAQNETLKLTGFDSHSKKLNI